MAAKRRPIAFLLWGVPAKAKGRVIDGVRHVVVPSAHPSPLSQEGFLKSRPFQPGERRSARARRGPDRLEPGRPACSQTGHQAGQIDDFDQVTNRGEVLADRLEPIAVGLVEAGCGGRVLENAAQGAVVL